MKITDLSPV